MQDPKKPDPNDTSRRRAPPPPRPAGRPGGPPPAGGAAPRPGGPPRPPLPPSRPPAGGGGLDAATPPAASESDEDLVFMTHAPGASVAPRAMTEVDKEVKEFEERLKQKEQEKAEKERAEKEKAERRKGAGPRPAAEPRAGAPREAAGGPRPAAASARSAPKLTRALVEGAGRLSEAAGVGAIQRTLQAGRGAQDGPMVAGESFFSLLPGALVAPLRRGSLGSALGATLLVAMALLTLEVSPPVGLIACAVVALEITALLVKHVRETGGGRDQVLWPTFGEMAGGFMSWAAAGLVLVPGVVVVALIGGAAPWNVNEPGSLPARGARVWSPPAEVGVARVDDDLPGGDARVPDALGRHALAMLDAAVGAPRPGRQADTRSARELAGDLAAAATGRVRALAPAPGAEPKQLAWRGLLALGLLVYPIALIACARLKSAYAALHAPMLLRAVLRAPVAYVVVLVSWLSHAALLGGALLLLPDALHARLGPAPAHLAWVAAVAVVAGPGAIVTASVLGRFYRSQAHALAWE